MQKQDAAALQQTERRLHRYLWGAGLAGLGIWAGVLGVSATYGFDKDSTFHSIFVALGNAGLTLAVGGVMGGYIKRMFDRIEEGRAASQKAIARQEKLRAEEVSFHQGVLSDFKRVYDIVEHARLLIDAHKSAKTYGEQVRALPDAIIILHNIKRALEHDKSPIRDEVRETAQVLIRFLKQITSEFQEHYLMVSRLQSQDEANNRLKRALAAETTQEPPAEISALAWAEIRKLPRLLVLRHDCPYIDEDVVDTDLEALRAEASGWFGDAAVPDKAGALLRRKYEVLFLDHLDQVSQSLRDQIGVLLKQAD